MKVAVSSNGQTLDSTVDARFGRCPYFLIVNQTTMEFEAISNPSAEQGGGAGIQSAQIIADKGASVLLTGNCGPNALNVFDKVGTQVVTNFTGSVFQVVQQFAAGSLKSALSTQTSPPSSGKIGRDVGGGRCVSSGGRCWPSR